jgi:MFS family permease
VDVASRESERWYSGISRYQWLVLIVASLGWVFDVFEGQIFVASMNEAMPALLDVSAKDPRVAYYNNLTFAAFLMGGALGGVLFGMLADRLGRKRTMTATILLYSAFTSVSAFAQTWWQMAAFRFLVALGVGGEWAVASALVAEVFPRRARARTQSIFHASSVFGTYLAVAVGALIVAQPVIAIPLLGGSWTLPGWRVGFLLGAVPALLIIWIRLSLRESELWLHDRGQATKQTQVIGDAPGPDTSSRSQPGSILDLFSPRLRRRTLVGCSLAAVGLATFWGTHIYGKDVLRKAYQASYLAVLSPEAPEAEKQALVQRHAANLKQAEMLGMFLVTTGGGLGLLAFGPLCEWWGRRGAFLVFHLGGLVSALLLFQVLSGVLVVILFLPIFGFLTLGMHAGYAVYFPELFPTRLRGTGGGFCFNVGRVLAAPILFLSGWMQRDWGFSLENASSLLSLLFLLGAFLLLLAPETKGQELPA